jgi:hypothetical protein
LIPGLMTVTGITTFRSDRAANKHMFAVRLLLRVLVKASQFNIRLTQRSFATRQ